TPRFGGMGIFLGATAAMLIPAGMNEQIKIGNILNSFDKKINLIQKQIVEMEEFKKGLLQSLFFYLILVLLHYILSNN
ncbi:MAG: hypothetical protein UHX91_04015, partial [Methanosphaera sp.]|nr:hypothetical protein [Methanosphaera sp.]